MDDVAKYAKNQTMTQVLRHIIRNLGGEAFLMLEKAFLVSLIYPTISSEIPVFDDRKKSPRLQMLDTGLLNFSAKIQTIISESTI